MKDNKLLKLSPEVIKYIFWGVMTTLVNWVIYTGAVMGAGCSMTLANGLAWCGAVLFAFVVNRKYVFERKDSAGLLHEFVMFVLMRSVSGVIEIFAPSFLYDLGLNQSILGVKGLLAKGVVSVVIIASNYVFSKLVVFKSKK